MKLETCSNSRLSSLAIAATAGAGVSSPKPTKPPPLPVPNLNRARRHRQTDLISPCEPNPFFSFWASLLSSHQSVQPVLSSKLYLLTLFMLFRYVIKPPTWGEEATGLDCWCLFWTLKWLLIRMALTRQQRETHKSPLTATSGTARADRLGLHFSNRWFLFDYGCTFFFFVRETERSNGIVISIG